MKEYIERAAALDICEKEYEERLRMADYCGDTVAWNIGGAIKSLPTADVVAVRHARWIKHEGYDECEACHTKATYGSKYCPFCGARMKKEAEHEAG